MLQVASSQPSLQCPSGVTFVRNSSQSLSHEESAWLAKRRPNVVQALQSYLINVGIEGLNVSEYVLALNNSPENAVPIIGLTWSGGGQSVDPLHRFTVYCLYLITQES